MLDIDRVAINEIANIRGSNNFCLQIDNFLSFDVVSLSAKVASKTQEMARHFTYIVEMATNLETHFCTWPSY